MSTQDIYNSEYLSKRAKEVICASIQQLEGLARAEFAESALNDAEMASCKDREFTDYLRSLID